MPVKIAFQMDRLSHLYKRFDTTLEIARAAAERGYDIFSYEPSQLRMRTHSDGVQITALGSNLIYRPADDIQWRESDALEVDLKEYDLIFMRQDPPFDLAYITATHILEHLSKHVPIINDPVGVRNAPEKLLMTQFPALMPPTLVTRDKGAIDAFRNEHGSIIIKPLYSFSGHGVFHVPPQDTNLAALIEMLATLNNEPWVIQKRLPVETCGDKRIMLVNGDPVGSYLRMPQVGDIRGNMRVTRVHPQAAPLTKRDKEICEALAPTLRARGLYLVGLDIIGDHLTEINVTSPTGFIFSDFVEGRTGSHRLAEQFWFAIERDYLAIPRLAAAS